MRASLIVNRPGPDRRKNLSSILTQTQVAAKAGAELVLFPEAALTGLINNDDPAHDLPLGETIPGPCSDELSACARQHGLWLGIGLLEQDGCCLYDSAILIDPSGNICLKYRRNQSQWHGCNADPAVYKQGTEIACLQTPFGSVAFLICGDLFDDGITARLIDLRPDYLFFPFARCFSDGTADQKRWDGEEFPLYLGRIRMCGVPALMVNYLGCNLPGDNSFGGAFLVSASGSVLSSLPLGQEGAMTVELA